MTARAAVAHSRAPVLLVGLVTTVLAVVLRLGLAGAQVTMVDVEVQVVLRAWYDILDAAEATIFKESCQGDVKRIRCPNQIRNIVPLVN